MTVSSGFFDSVNHDRLYNADQVSSMFDGLILDGVYENMGEAFAINAYPDAENTVIVGTGRAWFDHTWTLNDTQYALTLDPPSDSMSRIDAIVLDVDKTLEVRNNTIKLIKGTPVFTGEDPQKPTLIKEDLHNQYPLAYVTRSAGASATINQADIEYMVGTEECPMVIGLLEAINIEQVYAQLKDEFYLWWDGVILGDPDMATHLQDQIDELERQIDSINSNKITFDTIKSAAPFFSLDPYHSVYDCRPFILPDGYILFLFRGESENFPASSSVQNNMVNLYHDYSDTGSINCCLYSLDGIYSNYTNIATVNGSNGCNTLNDYNWLYCGTVLTEQTEEYPAIIRLVYLSGVDTDGVKHTSTNTTGSRMKLNGFTYTLAVIKITSDHVISVEKSSINVSSTLKNYYLDIGSGFGALGAGFACSHIPAIASNGNEYFFSVSGHSQKINSRAQMCAWTSFCVTKDNVFSMIENSDTSLNGLGLNNVIGNGGGSNMTAQADSIYPHIANDDNLMILCTDNTFERVNRDTVVFYAFTLDGHFSRAYKFVDGKETNNANLTIESFLSKISVDKDNLKLTDMSFVSDGYLYRQDKNNPSSLVKTPFEYQSVDVNLGVSPSYSVLFSDIKTSGETENEDEKPTYYLDYYDKQNISSSLDINSIVVTPDDSLMIASYVDTAKPGAIEDQQGIKVLILDGGSRGVFSSTYSYVLPLSEMYDEWENPMAFNTFANRIDSTYHWFTIYGQLGLKRNYWVSPDKKTYLVIVYGTTLKQYNYPWIYGVIPNAQSTIWRIDR